ncbi:MAG: NapC/NirT family cytochrome c [Acidobacteria bacterium]|nr:NapC/NirT family cytochrome c [Acidobacteriota bacterium]
MLWAWILAQAADGAHVNVDPVLVLLRQLSVGAAAAAVLMVLFLIFFQRKLTEGLLKLLAFVGLLVLPMISLALGNLVGLEQAKKVEFCGSCHLTMAPYVSDLRALESTSLAALHFRNRWIPDAQCYTCHASYGMFGDVQAKMAGLNDVYKYYTRTYTIPVRMHKPYPNAECLKCHENTPKFVDAEAHVDLLPAIRAGEFSCLDCHGPAHVVSWDESRHPR